MPTVPLRKMQKNQSGTITAVKVGGELGRRIRDMGIVPGTRIIIMGRAPLYDPVAIRIMGGTLTLRNSEADFIEVEIANPLKTSQEAKRTIIVGDTPPTPTRTHG